MCPDCREPLVVFELEGVEIDHCLACGGTWLDPGELEFLTEIAGFESHELAEAVRTAKSGKKSTRRCPRCPCRLRLIVLGKETTIELDRCPRCNGLWLDRGEMEEVMASSREGEGKAVAQFFSDLYRKELESQTKEIKQEGD